MGAHKRAASIFLPSVFVSSTTSWVALVGSMFRVGCMPQSSIRSNTRARIDHPAAGPAASYVMRRTGFKPSSIY